MIDRTVRTISQRLSLRKPQSDSLEILADVLSRVELLKGYDAEAALAAYRRARQLRPTGQFFGADVRPQAGAS